MVASVLFQSLPQKPNPARPGSPKGLGRTYSQGLGGGWCGVQLSEVPLPPPSALPQEIRMLKEVVTVYPVSARPGPRRLGGPETQQSGVGGTQRSPHVHRAGAGCPPSEVPGSSGAHASDHLVSRSPGPRAQGAEGMEVARGASGHTRGAWAMWAFAQVHRGLGHGQLGP